MIIDTTKFATFREFLDFMPHGTVTWLVEQADVGKSTIIFASQGRAIQQDTLDKLMRVTGLARSCFGPVNDKRTLATGKRVEAGKVYSSVL
jgi:hypothetical protein